MNDPHEILARLESDEDSRPHAEALRSILASPGGRAQVVEALMLSVTLRDVLLTEPSLLGDEEAELPASSETPASARMSASRRIGSSRRERMRKAPGRALFRVVPLAVAAGMLLVLGILLAPGNRSPRQGRRGMRPSPVRAAPFPIARKPDSNPALHATTERPKREEREPRPVAVQRREDPDRSPGIPALPAAPQPTPQGKVSIARAPGGTQARPRGEIAQSIPAGPETERHMARLAKVVGVVMVSRGSGGPWIKAQAGIPLLAGDRIDTRSGMARLETAGARVFVNQRSLLRLAPALVALDRGEIYVDERDPALRVETPDGLLLPLGTRFNVLRKVSSTVVTVEQGAVEARVKDLREPGRTSGASPAVPGKPPLRSPLYRSVKRIAAGQEACLRRGAEPRVSPITGPVGFWRARLESATDAAGKQILLLPRQARLVGADWRIVTDPDASSGYALEAPKLTTSWPWAAKYGGNRRNWRNRHTYVHFTFYAEADRTYHVWVRGRSTARERRTGRDAVALELVGGRFDRPCALLSHLGFPAYLFNGFSKGAHGKGYWWVGGNADRDADGVHGDVVPVALRFARSGRQSLKIYAMETPMRIDAVWLSATQRTRPDAGQSGPRGDAE